MQYFDDIRTNRTRALQIYQILIGKAHNRQTMTYGMLAELLGFGGAGVLDEMLGHIMHWCSRNQLPPLTALVVNRDTGLPGDGLIIPIDLHSEREAVFRYEWYKLYPPTPDEFDEVWRAAGGK